MHAHARRPLIAVAAAAAAARRCAHRAVDELGAAADVRLLVERVGSGALARLVRGQADAERITAHTTGSSRSGFTPLT